jgi:hypothetical protein
MKHIFTSLFFFFSFLSFSQIITFECNNEIISVSIDEIVNDTAIYMDWDGDNLIDENDYLLYLLDAYNCDNNDSSDWGGDDDNDWGGDDDNDWGGDDDNDWGGDDDNNWGGDDDNDWGGDDDNDWGDVFTFECNGEEVIIDLTNMNDFLDYESYIESILSDYDCEEWSDNNDSSDWGDDCVGTWIADITIGNCDEFTSQGADACNSYSGCEWTSFWNSITYSNSNDCVGSYEIDNGYCDDEDWNIVDVDWNVSDWEDFNWDIYWDELDLGNIDWENIIWDIIIEFDISPDDFIDYILSILGQPFTWDDFFASQACNDQDEIISTGLSIWTDVSGCSEALGYINSLGYDCFTELNLPFVSSDPITLFELCCETCEEINGGGDGVEGCTDSEACNYNSEATVDDGSCNYGVECFVSPCSVSEDPAIDGAYCIDDYCNLGDCCALWYYPDGTLIYNSCEDPGIEDSIVGLWFDGEQYVEITEDVIGFYTYIDEDEWMCWYYWSMEYVDLGNGNILVQDPEDGAFELPWSISEDGTLELLDPEGESIMLNPIDELPDLDMCNEFANNEGCEEFQGQWVYYFPNTEMEVIWMEIDESGVDFFNLGDDLCVDYINLSYDSLEGSDDCILFVDAYGGQFEFGELSINNDGTLSFTNMPGFPEDWPTVWVTGDFDSEEFMFCSYGCTDPSACNFDPFANADDGTCGLIDDCGDCQIPYCYDMLENTVDYISEDECDGVWIGNDCENNDYCLSSSMNPYWNSGCVSLDENNINRKIQLITNLLGQSINSNNTSGLKLYFYQNGDVEKQQIVK